MISFNTDYMRHRVAHFIRPVVDLESKLDPQEFGGGRCEGPFLIGEIEQFMCSVRGCGERASASWGGCADANINRPLCPEHDVQLNELALKWWGDPKADEKMAAYRERVERDIGRPLKQECFLSDEELRERLWPALN
jgi:hypothetical protein